MDKQDVIGILSTVAALTITILLVVWAGHHCGGGIISDGAFRWAS